MSINIMDKLDNLIKTVRLSIKDKKKFIAAKTLNKINEDFISIIFDSRKNEAKKKLNLKLKSWKKFKLIYKKSIQKENHIRKNWQIRNSLKVYFHFLKTLPNKIPVKYHLKIE